MRSVNYKAINAGDVSLTSVASSAIDSQNLLSFSAQAVVTGSSPVGVVKLQASNDFPVAGDLSPFTPTNWSDVANVTVAVTDAGVFLIPKTEICYQWVRFVYTKTSGTGAVTVNFKAIGF
jgi:hypothetical protein